MSEPRLLDRLSGLEEEAGELLETRTRTEVRDFTKWADNPVGFIRDVLRDDPWKKQREIAEAVRDYDQVTVRSCHAAGKDWLAGRLALWWVYAREGLVILTGPTAAQVEEILMRNEIRTAFVRGRLPGELHVRVLRPEGGGKAGILARTGSTVQGMQGFHDVRVFYCITEAQDPDIEHAWDAAFNCTTGAEDRKLTLGNPTEPVGKFYNAHRQTSGWHAVKIASTDIPNVQERGTVVPGLLTVQGVGRFIQEYGEGSPFVQSRVHAEFPETAEDSLVQRTWLDEAVARWKLSDPYAPVVAQFASRKDRGARVVLGVDPARLGPDQTMICARRGRRVLGFDGWRNLDTMRTAERVAEKVRALLSEGHPVQGTWIDEIGVGAGVLDRLRELLRDTSYDWMAPEGHRRDRVAVEGFNASRPPQERTRKKGRQRWEREEAADRFVNMRAVGYWSLRRRLERGEIDLPDDGKLIEELLSTRVMFTSSGQTQIEAKEEIKRRIGRSPDRADALVISLAPELDDGRPRVRFR